VAKQIDVQVTGLNAVLRGIRDFPPEAQAALRDESQNIADTIMAPAYRSAAMNVPYWGAILAAGIKAKRDRIPAVNIGYRKPKTAGGADPIMLRYPTVSGNSRESKAPFTATNWIDSAKGYKSKAMDAWGAALTRVVVQWNRGF
jgi:hypothetical protein